MYVCVQVFGRQTQHTFTHVSMCMYVCMCLEQRSKPRIMGNNVQGANRVYAGSGSGPTFFNELTPFSQRSQGPEGLAPNKCTGPLLFGQGPCRLLCRIKQGLLTPGDFRRAIRPCASPSPGSTVHAPHGQQDHQELSGTLSGPLATIATPTLRRWQGLSTITCPQVPSSIRNFMW